MTWINALAAACWTILLGDVESRLPGGSLNQRALRSPNPQGMRYRIGRH